MNHVRRILVALTTLPLLLAMARCGSDGFEEDSGGGGDTVTIVGQKFTEADIMTQLYKQLLEKEGFKTDVKNLGARDIYLDPLREGRRAGLGRLPLLDDRGAEPQGQRRRRRARGAPRRAGDAGPS